jgi:glutamine synthetase
MCAVSPLVNSYKRLVAGYEAPVYIGWAHQSLGVDRSPRTSLRITRLELRCPDPAAILPGFGDAGCVDGIRRELPVPDANEENLYRLDMQYGSAGCSAIFLNQALKALEDDPVVCSALGAHIFDRFIRRNGSNGKIIA